MAARTDLPLHDPRLVVERCMLEDKLKLLDALCAENKIEPLVLSQVEECRALQYQCQCREAAIVQNGKSAESLVLSLFSRTALPPDWLKIHLLEDDRVLRVQHIANLDIWNHCLNITQIKPLSQEAKDHIYEWNARDHWCLDRPYITGFESSHQDNQVAAEELVKLKVKEPPPSESSHGPQPDSNYGTGLGLESAPIRNRDVVVDKPDAGGRVHGIPESRQYLTDVSFRESHEAEQSTFDLSSISLCRCLICQKLFKSKFDLKRHFLQHIKPFRCTNANCHRIEGFNTVNDLNRHKQSKHPDDVSGEIHSKTYRCLVAGCKAQDEIWSHQDKFRSHLKHVHGLQAAMIDYFVQQGEYTGSQNALEMGGMMQRSASTLMDTESVPLGSQSITPPNLLDPFGFLDDQHQNTITTNKVHTFVPTLGNADNPPGSTILAPPIASQDAASSDHIGKNSEQLRRQTHEPEHFEQQNANYAPLLDIDAFAFMHPITTNERAPSDSLPPREEEPAPLSPLALLSSVATSWENSNDTVPSQGQNSIKDSENTVMYSHSGAPSMMLRQAHFTELLLASDALHSRSLSSEIRHNTPAPTPSEDEEMADTPDYDESASITPKADTVPKLRKHPAKFECYHPDCKKRFTRRVNLQAHIRAHSNNVQSYVCRECGRKFARIEDHKRHVKERHTSISKPHVCGILGKPGLEGCGQSFTRAEALRRHLRSKAGSKCGKSVDEQGPEETTQHSGDETSVHGQEQDDSDVMITDESSWLRSRGRAFQQR